MSLSGMKEWICNFLHSPCTAPPTYKLLKPFYNTYCFFHKALCNTYTDVCDKHIRKTSTNIIEQKVLDAQVIKSKCELSHYFDYLFKNISSSSCNIKITPVKVPFRNQNSCKITDYFYIWLNETSSRVFSQVSCKTSDGEYCYLNWCSIYSYAEFWWTELYKKWCYFANCINQQKMQLLPEPGAALMERAESRFERWIRNWMSHNLGIEWPKHINFFQFAIAFCSIGGTCLFILILIRKKFRFKQKTVAFTPKSLKVEGFDAKAVQTLIEFVEKSKSEHDNLKKEFENLKKANLELAKTNQNANNQIKNMQLQINKVKEVHVSKQVETEKQLYEQLIDFQILQEQACKLEQKCIEYQNQIHILNQSLYDLQEDQKIKLYQHLEENKNISHQLKETKDQLEHSHGIHQNLREHAKKLEKTCTDYQNQSSVFARQLHDLQKNHETEIKKYLEDNKEIRRQIKEVHGQLNVSQHLRQTEMTNLQQTIAQLEAQDKKKTEEFKQQRRKYQQNLQETQNWLQKAEEVCNQQRDFIAAVNVATTTESAENRNEVQINVPAESTHQQDPYIVQSLEKINVVFKDTEELKKQIDEFSGNKEDKTYLHLNELLIRNTIKLDNVESEGHFIIRKKRKEALEYINKCVSLLESKLIE